MGDFKFCSNCGSLNKLRKIEGRSRYYCIQCNIIHYENPKPTVSLICHKKAEILLVKRAIHPRKNKWCLPGGFMETKENLNMAAKRELKEETGLSGYPVKIIGTCSDYNTIFGDILLIGIEIRIKDWTTIKAGDDASDARLYKINNMPKLAFKCHEKLVSMYKMDLK